MSSPAQQGRQLAVRTQLTLDVLIGSIARIVLALVTSYRQSDAEDLAAWARTMHDRPLADFYSHARRPDHLPGDLWLLKALESCYSALGGRDFASSRFELLTNLVPIAADVVVGVLLFRIALTWGSEASAARTARWYLLNPAVIVLAGAWGQWDSVSMGIFLLGLLLILGARRAWLAPVALMTCAVLMKPPLGVAAFGMLAWQALRPIHRASEHRWPLAIHGVGRACATAVTAAVCAVAVLQPFRVGLAWAPAGGSSLVDRLEYAADLHPYTTVGAANIWLLVDRSVIGPVDDLPRWGRLSPLELGIGLAVVLWCLVLAVAWRAYVRSARLEPLLWGCGAAAFASCLVLTRVHERYYFPALVLLLLWVSVRGFDRPSGAWFWSFSVLFVVDLVLPMGWTGHDTRLLHQPEALVLVGLSHMVLFATLIVFGLRDARLHPITAGARWEANDARRTAPG